MIGISFVLATLSVLLQGALLNNFFSLFAYAPFLAIVSMRSSFRATLWWAFLGGIIHDLFTSGPIGLYSWSAVGSAALLYRYRTRWFTDRWLQFCALSAALGAVETLLRIFIFFLFDKQITGMGVFLIRDLLFAPWIQLAYAFFVFTGPLLLWEWGIKQIYRTGMKT